MFLTLFVLVNVVWISHGMSLAKRMVDLTYTFDETTLNYPLFKSFRIENLKNGSLEEFHGMWLQVEEYSSGTHVGTHMDAPSHYIKGGKTIDQIPPSQFVGPAAVIDITARAAQDPLAEVTTDDLLQWESGTGQSLDGAIIMLRTGWGRKWDDRPAFYGTDDDDKDNLKFPGISAEACQWLVDNRHIKGIGTETLSIDVGNSRDFPSHVIILGHDIFILENVANLDKLPLYGARIGVFPMKIGRGSGAPTRIIATIPEIMYDLPNE